MDFLGFCLEKISLSERIVLDEGDGLADLQVIFFQVFEQVKVVVYAFDNIVTRGRSLFQSQLILFVQKLSLGWDGTPVRTDLGVLEHGIQTLNKALRNIVL